MSGYWLSKVPLLSNEFTASPMKKVSEVLEPFDD